MKVFSLTGESGTGKSSNAISFAHEHDIPAIIDDGLLIYDGKKIAGHSAKFEKTMIAAVKRAIFNDDDHANSVKDAIKELNIKRILIIGTSMRMVNRIAERLEIAPIDTHYYIENILTEEEIEKAKHERATKGRHIIPLPYKQLDQNLFQKMIQRGIDIFSPQREKIGETTIVHPYFHRRLLARLRKERAKQKEKRLKKRAARMEKTYQSDSRFVYITPTKEQLANLLPAIMNYINEQLIILKDKVIHYYDVSKQYVYEAVIQLLAYLLRLLDYLIEQYELLFKTNDEAIIYVDH